MTGESAIHNKQIRWLILLILLQNQRSKNRESGGYIRLAMLQRLLQAQGYALDKEEIKTFCVYLADKEIGCLEIAVEGDHKPFVYRYRLTAKGMRAANDEERVPGVGIWD